MSDPTRALPTSIRRLEGSPDARRLVRLVSAYDELQTVLRCCERLVAVLGTDGDGSDDIGIDALWTLALLFYARAFAGGDGAALTEADLATAGADAVRWHRVLLRLRDAQADPEANPRETYTVGVAQDRTGAANAVAVTSVRAPRLDAGAVRQAGALAFPLCAVLDERIGPLQEQVLATARAIAPVALNRMQLVQVAAET